MQSQPMTFWEHLDELRKVLLRVIVAIAVLMVGLFIAMPYLFDHVILAPCSNDFILYRALRAISQRIPFLPDFAMDDFSVSLINIQLASQFFIHMSTSMWMAVVLAFPFILYQLWCFISPALYENELRNVRFAFLAGNILFFTGIAVGYFLVFPLTLRFLASYQISTLIPNQISLDSYIGNFLSLTFIMGIVFELPLLCKLLSAFGLIDRSFFARYRRHAIIVLLIVAAIITPSGDPFTLLAVFIPIYAVYEVSALFVKQRIQTSK